MNPTRRLARLLRPERLLLLLSVLATAVAAGAMVVAPLRLGHATDLIFARETGGELLRTLLQAAGLYVLASAALIVQGRLLSRVVQRAMHRLRGQAQAKLARLPLREFDDQPKGDLLSKVANDIDNLAQSLSQAFGQLLIAGLTLIGVVAAMFLVSPLLALVVLGVLPVGFLAGRLLTRWSKPHFLGQWTTTGKLNAHIEEQFTGHALVRVYGREDAAVREFDVANDRLYTAAFRAQFVSGLVRPVMMLMGNLNYLIVAVAGAVRVASGGLTIGDVQAFLQYTQQAGQSVSQVAGVVGVVQSALASATRVFELLDTPEEHAVPDAKPAAAKGRVEFDHVSFSYTEKPLITDLSLSVEPGQTVAIVGPTGAGKTTLVNLLMRFYELDAGRILIDGVDTAALSRPDVRTQIGMVLQDTWLFHGTIAENIAYGSPDATREEIIAAAKATYVDHFVRTLPDGYGTIVDGEATALSAGEKQLITIARAFLSARPILILDEATSSVDTRTELLIQRALAALRTDRTSFVIAHRLSTIRDADLILVLDQGRIVEQGSHAELLSAGGFFAHLHDAQFAGAR